MISLGVKMFQFQQMRHEEINFWVGDRRFFTLGKIFGGEFTSSENTIQCCMCTCPQTTATILCKTQKNLGLRWAVELNSTVGFLFKKKNHYYLHIWSSQYCSQKHHNCYRELLVIMFRNDPPLASFLAVPSLQINFLVEIGTFTYLSRRELPLL